ncbi:tautomerase family protein [Marinobacter nauticus]|uniref:tautomerase family protein n=1 Tax=Marinobacter nauticus TaxID=2743 RepID=UPI001CD4784A|nr:tautomerase family protein [Marinobacter nauticus]MCA0912425.1 hypothetical protein [Marinobacter nauticus]
MIGNVILLLPLKPAARPTRNARQRTVRVAGQISAALVKQARFTPMVATSSANVQPLAGFPMPICTVTVANLALSQQQKSQIAEATAAAHNAQTGAPRFFAQVLFSAASEGEHFVGGRANTAPQVYLHGLVREGRRFGLKQALMNHMPEAMGQIVAGAALEEPLFSLLAKELGKPFPF